MRKKQTLKKDYGNVYSTRLEKPIELVLLARAVANKRKISAELREAIKRGLGIESAAE